MTECKENDFRAAQQDFQPDCAPPSEKVRSNKGGSLAQPNAMQDLRRRGDERRKRYSGFEGRYMERWFDDRKNGDDVEIDNRRFDAVGSRRLSIRARATQRFTGSRFGRRRRGGESIATRSTTGSYFSNVVPSGSNGKDAAPPRRQRQEQPATKHQKFWHERTHHKLLHICIIPFIHPMCQVVQAQRQMANHFGRNFREGFRRSETIECRS
jgi:hypothetical protein